MLVLLQLGGCASIRSHWPLGNQSLPVTPTYNHHRPASPAAEQPANEEKGTNQADAVRKESATVSVPKQTPPAEAGTTNVTLEDNDGDHLRAQSLLDDADSRLAHIDRSKLTGDNATTYHQASVLASAARKAMEQRDYLAASGLARKATLLTLQLTARVPRR
jgi:hypothetical protein